MNGVLLALPDDVGIKRKFKEGFRAKAEKIKGRPSVILGVNNTKREHL